MKSLMKFLLAWMGSSRSTTTSVKLNLQRKNFGSFSNKIMKKLGSLIAANIYQTFP